MSNERNTSLTSGDIIKQLITLALPIIGTSFVQTAYNLIDMFWIGFLGSNAVAAVGIAGFYVWFSNGLVLLSRTGTEIRVAQTTGATLDEKAKRYARAGLASVLGIAIIYTVIIQLFRYNLIDFFGTEDPIVDGMSREYLQVVSIGFIFAFFNQVMTGIFNGRGDSRLPFILNTIGLGINILLDPLLIFGLGPIGGMGVIGAALATVIAQGCITIIFIYQVKIKHRLFHQFRIFNTLKGSHVMEIFKLGLPAAAQSVLFTITAMVIARIVAVYGPLPIAAQKVGSQIESITWMTATGFSVAISAFVGQNYGAQAYDRVRRGFSSGLKIAVGFGLFNSLLLFFGARLLFMIFIREADVIPYGVDYLKILALSQLFMYLEITMTGVFNGMGHTQPPAVISITLNVLRIPMALYLSMYTTLGINGIWWAITISSIIKGIINYIWLRYDMKRTLKPSLKS